MTINRVIIVSALLLAAAFAQQTYQLVWSEEFNGNSLDTSIWHYQNLCDGAGNRELQCYTQRQENVAVRNGSLVITPRVENYGGKRYTSGRVSTGGKRSWTYGRFDIRAKLPDGLYLWPAIWMMPERSVYGPWAASGEIDIMENRGGQNREHSGALHFGGTSPRNAYAGSGSRQAPVDLTRDYHVYSLIWTPDSIQWLLDGQVFHTENLRRSFNNAAAGAFPYGDTQGAPFNQAFHFILNLAIGGDFFGPSGQNLTPEIASGWRDPVFLVDYCRVYQLRDGVGANPSPAPAPPPAPMPTVVSTECKNMWNGLTCRPASENADAGQVQSTRNWICNNHGKHCTDINGSGKFSGCPLVYQTGYAMSGYYREFVGSQGAGACNFGGLGRVVTPSTPATQPPPACPNGQQQCQDVTQGNICFNPNTFDCVTGGDNKKALCPKGTSLCGTACYPPSRYRCTNGWLAYL